MKILSCNSASNTRVVPPHRTPRVCAHRESKSYRVAMLTFEKEDENNNFVAGSGLLVIRSWTSKCLCIPYAVGMNEKQCKPNLSMSPTSANSVYKVFLLVLGFFYCAVYSYNNCFQIVTACYYIRFKYYLVQCNFCWDFGESGEEMNFMMPLSYLFLFLHAETIGTLISRALKALTKVSQRLGLALQSGEVTSSCLIGSQTARGTSECWPFKCQRRGITSRGQRSSSVPLRDMRENGSCPSRPSVQSLWPLPDCIRDCDSTLRAIRRAFGSGSTSWSLFTALVRRVRRHQPLTFSTGVRWRTRKINSTSFATSLKVAGCRFGCHVAFSDWFTDSKWYEQVMGIQVPTSGKYLKRQPVVQVSAIHRAFGFVEVKTGPFSLQSLRMQQSTTFGRTSSMPKSRSWSMLSLSRMTDRHWVANLTLDLSCAQSEPFHCRPLGSNFTLVSCHLLPITITLYHVTYLLLPFNRLCTFSSRLKYWRSAKKRATVFLSVSSVSFHQSNEQHCYFLSEIKTSMKNLGSKQILEIELFKNSNLIDLVGKSVRVMFTLMIKVQTSDPDRTTVITSFSCRLLTFNISPNSVEGNVSFLLSQRLYVTHRHGNSGDNKKLVSLTPESRVQIPGVGCCRFLQTCWCGRFVQTHPRQRQPAEGRGQFACPSLSKVTEIITQNCQCCGVEVGNVNPQKERPVCMSFNRRSRRSLRKKVNNDAVLQLGVVSLMSTTRENRIKGERKGDGNASSESI
ncbi:hypothetical protein DAPPUDRAFT_111716 [Daphnia pulex]|uniref:Uncharacterized protein n=1 Tax=Daphnia pulex TaxID=6669 RepID=E9H9N2_DAPPU|nr:hypothetical protein DAPPUDRAFT_111716 [Daphnia pulex]|eukprot:EFX71517.1 hypothetical protein DAPPUDRAFT_111716 [Daphnia pulex]